MTSAKPPKAGFIDEDTERTEPIYGSPSHVAATPSAELSDQPRPLDAKHTSVRSDAARPIGPTLIEDQEGASGRIDLGWEAEVHGAAPATRQRSTGVSWIGYGLASLFVGLLLVNLATYIVAQFDRSIIIGILSVAVVIGGLGLVVVGIWKEVDALLRIRTVDFIRAGLIGETHPLVQVRDGVLQWMNSLDQASAPRGEAVSRMRQAENLEALRSALDAAVLMPLDMRARGVVKRAAAEVFGSAALSPIPAVDAMVFIYRALRLLREVASIYGLRPGVLATWTLARQTLANAALVATTDELSGRLAASFFGSAKVQHWIGELAGAGVAAQRMLRFGTAAMSACRILPMNAKA